MEFQNYSKDNYTIIKLIGRMDASNSNLFETEVAKHLENDENSIIADFEELEYISSAGLRSILVAGKKVKAENRALKLCNLNGMVTEVFEISGFSSIFQIFDSIEGAIEET